MKKILYFCLLFFGMIFLVSCKEDKKDDNNLNDTPDISNPQQLHAPNITLKDNIISWEQIENADGYIVSKNNIEQKEQSTLSYVITDTNVGDYEIKVKAVCSNKEKFLDSAYSNVLTYKVESKEEEPVGPVVLEPATLFVVGDSTVSSFNDNYYYPRYGYGTQLGNYFDSKLTIKNYALSGRSSKSFILENNYTLLSNEIKKGDYLLVGFGHNDEKSDDIDRFTDASKPTTDSSSFKYSLYEYYVKFALEKEAIPILCTPIVRADKNNTYTASSGHITANGDYAKAIIELGEEKGITVVNLRDLTKEKYESLGYNEAIYYHAMTSGKYDTDHTTIIPDTTTVDTTHINIYGAKFVAYLVANELKKSTNKLGKYVLDEIKEPSKDKDLLHNTNYIVKEYSAPNLSSYQAPTHFKTITEGWYGTAFGDCGGSPMSSGNGFVAKENVEGVFTVGQSANSSKGKFASGGDGFAFLFRQVEISKNFEIIAEAKVTATASTKQSGFGLMLRDDCFINQTTSPVTILSNYIAAGFITNEMNMNILFNRESATLNKESNTINSLYALNDTATFKIIRLGQSITATVIYKDITYTKTYLDFDLVANDGQYMYIGMYATRGTIVEFTNVDFKITGESLGA